MILTMRRLLTSLALSLFVVTVLCFGISGQQAPAAPAPIVPPVISVPDGAAKVEQTTHGTKPSPTMIASFDGLGVGFEGPQGMATLRNPSDNTLAVGPNHVVQIVNSRTAIFTKKGRKFDTTGRVLYGPVETANVFKGFGGRCEVTNNGDAVARYDQIANRWLIVMPLFRRGPVRPDQPGEWKNGGIYESPIGRSNQPGPAAALFQPPAPPPAPPGPPGQRGRGDQPGPARAVFDVLRDQHQRRSAGFVLSLRVPAAALSRLSASGDLARRLLRADQHRRRRDPEARLCRRARQNAEGPAGDASNVPSSTASTFSTTPTSTARRCRRAAHPT